MPAYNGRVAIVGIAESDSGRVPNMTELQLHAQAIQRALEDSGLRKQEIDGVFCSSDTMIMPTVTLCEYMQVFPRYTDSTSIGGASFEAHLHHAVAAIRTGQCQVALISYASTELSSRGRTIGSVNQPVTIPEATYEIAYGNTLVGAYAMAARRHMHQYGTTSEQLAEIAVVTRRHAGLNPLAMYRKPITVQDVLDSRMIADPLHLLDCCVVSDGGGAVLVTTEERARDLRQPPVFVLASSESHTHDTISQMPDLTVTAAAVTGPRAFAEAGVRPDEMDMAMVYDSFTITVLLLVEDLGFCKKGGGWSICAGRADCPGGTIAN
jgi:acetyl-CoA acetyltransferase